MNNQTKKKKEPWRIIAFVISITFIAFLWIKKDVSSIYASVTQEQMLPFIATTVAVSLLKVGIIAGSILLLKWIIGNIKKKNGK